MVFLGLALALLPGFAWLWFYLKEDLHPEPKALLAAVFVSGGAFAFLALAAQVILQQFGILPDPSEGIFSSLGLILTLCGLAFIEEIAKFAAAWLNIHNKPDFDEPVDAMIYLVVAALGFATIENIGSVTPGPGEVSVLSGIFETLSLRFVGATLLHALASAIVGYYWAVTIRDFGMTRYVAWGVLLATSLHAVFNFLIITYGSIIYALLFVLAVGLFVLHDFEKLKFKSL